MDDFDRLVREAAAAAPHPRRRSVARGLALLASLACLWLPVGTGLARVAADAAVVRTAEASTDMPDADAARLIANARAYNARLAATQVPSSIGETVEGDAVESSYASDTGYQRQLDGGDGVMATVRVPRIGVVLPVYHGTSSRVLDIGAGHVHGTSLPVGGRGTRTVLSAHSNVLTPTLFTRLDELKAGDVFSIDTHGLVLRYRVISIWSVDPSDTSALAIEPGRDLATLATCTGTGNSRRLLVTGERYTPRGHASAGVDWGGAVRTAGSVAAAGCLVGLPACRLTQRRRLIVRHSTAARHPFL